MFVKSQDKSYGSVVEKGLEMCLTNWGHFKTLKARLAKKSLGEMDLDSGLRVNPVASNWRKKNLILCDFSSRAEENSMIRISMNLILLTFKFFSWMTKLIRFHTFQKARNFFQLWNFRLWIITFSDHQVKSFPTNWRVVC